MKSLCFFYCSIFFFAELSFCIREETSPGEQGKFKDSLVGAMLLKPFDSHPQLFKAKCIKNCNPAVFKMLINSEIECLRLKIPNTYNRSPYGLLPIPCRATHICRVILGDPWPGAVSRGDKMFVVKVYCKITVNFHHDHFIDPTNCPSLVPRAFPLKNGWGAPPLF